MKKKTENTSLLSARKTKETAGPFFGTDFAPNWKAPFFLFHLLYVTGRDLIHKIDTATKKKEEKKKKRKLAHSSW